jgi:oligopeptide transport system substrate-binding protein
VEPYLGTYYYLFNVRRPPLDKAAVRRALSMSVDREKLVLHVTRAGEAPAHHFTPPDTAGFTAQARIPFDPAGARRLLAEAGFPGGRGFPRVELLYNTSDAHAKIAQAIQQMWKTELGVEVELVNMEWAAYLARTQDGRYDLARAGWIGDYVDPNSFLDMWVTGGGNNRTGWSDPRYDQLIRSAVRAPDNAARHALFQEAERILAESAPVLPLYFYRSKCLIRPSVRGWPPNIVDHHPYKHVYLQAP